MKLFRKLHERVEPPGLEWKLLKKMPRFMVAATVAPLLVALGARFVYADGIENAVAKQLMSIDIFCVAVAVTTWTAIATVSLGCIVVHIMKGPGYVADGYDVPHSDKPKRRIDD